MYTADLHCDTISKIWHAKLRGENASLKNSDDLAQPLHIDLGKLKAGQYVLQNFALHKEIRNNDSRRDKNNHGIANKRYYRSCFNIHFTISLSLLFDTIL